jgi:FkbM family methyltransferase
VEVGANHPTHDSVSRTFYDRGWSGVTVEPVQEFADLQRAERPRDTLVQAAVSTADGGEITLHVIPGSGLSTTIDSVSEGHLEAGYAHVDVVVPTVRLDSVLSNAGLDGSDIHFLLVDVEGAERDVLESINLTVWRPWIVVVESTAPLSTSQTHDQWEGLLLDQGYEFCLFDGISRYYVSSEKAGDLRQDLSYGASLWDDYVTVADVEAKQEREELLTQVIHWRTVALSNWSQVVSRDIKQQADLARLRRQIRRLRDEVKHLRGSTSWRVTAPLRKVSSVVGRR